MSAESVEISEGMKLFLKRASVMVSQESSSRGLNFRPRADDVFVVTYPKCGTTWMQQIVHQLRSGGDMSFVDIHDVIPDLRTAYDFEVDLDAEQNYKPRCFKSHCSYHLCPKGAKYIVIYREPCAAFYSFFSYVLGWVVQPGEISLHEFVKDFLLSKGTSGVRTRYFEHLLGWWKHRNDSNVLFIFFEDMKEGLESVVRKVAIFIGIHDDERIKKAVEMSSFKFMKAHESKFSEIRLAQYCNKAMGVPEKAIGSKVATGSATKGQELMDEETKDLVQAKWLEVVGKQTGFLDYHELRIAFHKEEMKIN